MVQIAIFALGDQFNEQYFVNVCWGISFTAGFMLIQIKMNMVIANVRNEIRGIELASASPYIRQGRDAELMAAK